MLITITNQKGGVGKTMLTVHLAAWLAEKGASVGVIDADNQGAAAEWLAKCSPAVRVITAIKPDAIVAAIDEFVAEGRAIVADAPPGLGEGTITMLSAANVVLLPVKPSFLDLRATIQAVATIKAIEAQRGFPVPARIMVNMKKTGASHTKMAEDWLAGFGIPVSSSTIGQRTAFENAAVEGTVVWRPKDMKKRDLQAIAEIEGLFTEVLNYVRETQSNGDGFDGDDAAARRHAAAASRQAPNPKRVSAHVTAAGRGESQRPAAEPEQADAA
jgi:chromosome partitioning protein